MHGVQANESDYTRVLGDLSLGYQLLAFRVHEFTILVLFQALEHALSIGFRAETLQDQRACYNVMLHRVRKLHPHKCEMRFFSASYKRKQYFNDHLP